MVKKIIKTLALLLVLIIVIGAALFVAINLSKKDDANYTINKELMPEEKNISNEDNAYFALQKIKIESAAPKNVIEEYIYKGDWNISEARQKIEKEAQNLVLFNEAATKPAYWHPESEIQDETSPKIIQEIKKSAALSAIRILLLSKDKQDWLAIEETLNLIKIGQAMMDANGFWEYKTGLEVKNIGLETMRKISVTSKLTSSELKRYIDYLWTTPVLVDEYQIKFQYAKSIEIIDALKNRDRKTLQKYQAAEVYNQFFRIPYLFMPNKTKKIFEEKYLTDLTATRKLCGTPKTTTAKNNNTESPLSSWENKFGKTLTQTTYTYGELIRESACQQKLLQNATILSLAAKAYYNDQNAPFETLEELIPDYIEEIPLDPYTEKPLLYSLEKKITYSLGKSGIDMGGDNSEDWTKMANPSFDLNFQSSIPLETSSSTATSTEDITEEETENASSTPENQIQDNDKDGISNQEEREKYHTDPDKADTDGDGYDDGQEIKNGYNPNGDGKL